MYESPIILSYFNEIKKQHDENIYQAVLKCGVSVDKDELIKALQYDRNQYDKGYQDAMNAIVRCEECKHWQVSVDGIHTWCSKRMGMTTNKNDFCSYGEKMDRKGEGDV